MAISFSEGVRRARERATYEAGLSAEVNINRDPWIAAGRIPQNISAMEVMTNRVTPDIESMINADYSRTEERLLSSTFPGTITGRFPPSDFISNADIARSTISSNRINVNHGWYSPNYSNATTSTISSSALTQQQIEQMVAMIDRQGMEALKVEMMQRLHIKPELLNAIEPKEPKEPNPQMELF